MTTETASNQQADASTAFLRAARAGQIDKIISLLEQGVDINVSNVNGLSAIHLASKDGHVAVVKELLNRGADIDAATNKGNTALHIASLAGQEDVVKLLVQCSAEVNVQSQNGFTPLYMAAQENHDGVVKFLLANQANQGLATEDGFTPLAVAMQQGHDKVVTVLLEADTKGKVRLPALHIAAKKDDIKAATLLLQNEHNPDVTSKSGFTPLHIAAHYGNESIAKLLLTKGADVNCPAKHNICPLHVAAKWGKDNMVILLCDNGANVESRTRDGLTPLHCAARSGHERVVETLLGRGAPITSKSKNGLSPLHMAAQGEHVEAARALITARAPVDDVTVDYLTPLHVAAHTGHHRVAKFLLDRSADANARALNGFTPLHIACKKNRIKVVELLLKYGASIQATTESGLTPLHVAAFMGCMNIVIYLLQHEASPDVPTVRGETPLHLASRANQTDIIRILLRNGAAVDAKAREKQTPLHIASRLGNVDIVVLLLQHGADVRSTTADMHNALHIAAKHHNHDVAAALIEHGAPLSATTKKGFTPLHLAAKYGNIKVANLLLSHGASPDIEGKSGMTPLHVAAQYDKQTVATALLEKGADAKAVAKNGHTPLHIASRKNQIETAAALMEYGAVANTESKAGFTPLHLAAQQGHIEMCSLLIEHGADVNQQAKNGLSALHLAAQEDRAPVAKMLVKHGAELNIETNGGYTPLHVASHFGQANMTKFLLENEASVKAQTSHGYTALHHAAQQGHINIVNVLLEHKADANATTNNGQSPLDIASKLGYVTIMETLKGVSESPQAPLSLDKYKVVAPEGMLETFCSDSEEEAGDDLALNDQPYRYLTADDMKSLGDDSLPIDVTRDERAESALGHKNVMESSTGSANGMAYAPQEVVIKNRFSTAAAPEGYCYNVDPSQPNFLVSFVVDARGGAWRGARGAGVRLIVPPSAARQPSRLTCRYLKPSRINHMPPLMEGEALAARVLEMGPVAAKFLGPIILEVPHYASLRGKEREIVILRSDNGNSWREHSSDSSLDQMQDLLNETIEIEEPPNEEAPGTPNPRVVRILTHDFPQYFAVISRIRQEVHAIGPEGGMVSSSVVPQVQAVFPQGALTKKIKVGLQAQIIDSELTAKLLGRGVAVSPVVTVEPRRRKFHKAITLSMPAPRPHTQGMTNQYSTSSAPTLRLLCSISGGTNRAHWEDVTENTPLTFVNDCVSFTTTVSARYWLIDCRHVEEATKMATDLYKAAIHVPFMARFIVYTRRTEQQQAQLRMFCVTDDKEDKMLERIERFTQVAKSRDVEVHEGKPCYLEFAGNLVAVAKSGEQIAVPFKAFRENRLAFPVMVKSAHADPIARCLFMREPKVAKGDPTPAPICVLNIVIPEDVVEIQIEKTSPQFIAQRNAEQELLWKQRLNDPCLEEICTLLGKDWVALAYELGVGVATVNQIQAKRISTVEQAQLMLKLWRTQSGTKSKDNCLELALCRIGRDDIIAPQSEVSNERRIQRNIYQERQASEEIEAYKAEDDNKLADRRNYDDNQISRISEKSRESEHDQDEAKYSPEEKSFYEKSEIERTPTPSEDSEDEAVPEFADVKRSVAERKEQITKKLSTTKIPASKQKKEIREEIIEIKTQIKPDIKKFQDIEQQVKEQEPKLERTRSKPSPDTVEDVTKATIETEILTKKETQVIAEKTSETFGKFDPSSPAKPTPKHLQRHMRNDSMRFPSGDFSNVTITPRKASIDKTEVKVGEKQSDISIVSETISHKEIISSKVEEKSYDGDKSPDLIIDNEKDVAETSLKEKICSFESKLSKDSSIESSSTGTTVKLTKEALKKHTMAQEQNLEYTQEFVREQFKINKEEEIIDSEELKPTDAIKSVKDAIQQFDIKTKGDDKKVKSMPAAMRTDSTLVQVSSEEDAEYLKKSTDSETEIETQVVKTEKVSKLKKSLPSLDKDKVFKDKTPKKASPKDDKKPDDEDKKGASKIPVKIQKSTSKGKVNEVKESFERKTPGSESSKSEISPKDLEAIEASTIVKEAQISPNLQKPTELKLDIEAELTKTKEQTEDFLKYETEYSSQFGAPTAVVKSVTEPQMESSPIISAKARQFIETVPEEDSVQECFFSKRIYSDSLEDSEQSDSRRHSEADSLKSDQSDVKVKLSSSDFDERAEYDGVVDSGSGFGDEKFEESVGFTSLKLDTVGVDVERLDTDTDKTEDSADIVFKKMQPKRFSKTESLSITKLSDLQQEDLKSKQEFQVVVTEAEELGHYFDKEELSDKISSESSREIEISERKSSEGVSDRISSEDAVTEKKTSSEEDPIKETEKFLEHEKGFGKSISKLIDSKTLLQKDDTFERVDVSKRQSVESAGSGVELRFEEKRLSDAHSLTESRDYTFEESEDDIRTHETHLDKEKLEKVEDIISGKVDIAKARLTHGDSLDDVESFPEDHIEHITKLPLIAEIGPAQNVVTIDASTIKASHQQKVEIKECPTLITREDQTVSQKSIEPRVITEVKSIIKDVKSSSVEHIETKKESTTKFDVSKLRTDTLTKFTGLPSDSEKSPKFLPKDSDLEEVQEITKEQIEPVIDDIIQKGTMFAAIKSPSTEKDIKIISKETFENKYDAKAPFKEERRHSCISPAVSLERIAESDVETDEDIPKYPSKEINKSFQGEVVTELKKSDSTMKQMADNIEIIIKQASEEIDLSSDDPIYLPEVDQQRQDIANNVSVDSIIEEAITTVEEYMDNQFESKTIDFEAKRETAFDDTKKVSTSRPALLKSLSRDSGEVVILPKKKNPRTFSVQSSPEEIEEHIYTDSESDMDKAKVLEIIEPSSDGKASAHFDTQKLKTDSLDDADELFPEKESEYLIEEQKHDVPLGEESDKGDKRNTSYDKSFDYDKVEPIGKSTHFVDDKVKTVEFMSPATDKSMTNIVSTLTSSSETEQKSVIEETTSAEFSKMSGAELLKDSSRTSIDNKDDFKYDDEGTPEMSKKSLDLTKDYSKSSVDSKDTSRDFATNELSKDSTIDLTRDYSKASIESVRDVTKSIEEKTYSEDHSSLDISKTLASEASDYVEEDSPISKSWSRETSVMAENKAFALEGELEENETKNKIKAEQAKADENVEMSELNRRCSSLLDDVQGAQIRIDSSHVTQDFVSKFSTTPPPSPVDLIMKDRAKVEQATTSDIPTGLQLKSSDTLYLDASRLSPRASSGGDSLISETDAHHSGLPDAFQVQSEVTMPKIPAKQLAESKVNVDKPTVTSGAIELVDRTIEKSIDVIDQIKKEQIAVKLDEMQNSGRADVFYSKSTIETSTSSSSVHKTVGGTAPEMKFQTIDPTVVISAIADNEASVDEHKTILSHKETATRKISGQEFFSQTKQISSDEDPRKIKTETNYEVRGQEQETKEKKTIRKDGDHTETFEKKLEKAHETIAKRSDIETKTVHKSNDDTDIVKVEHEFSEQGLYSGRQTKSEEKMTVIKDDTVKKKHEIKISERDLSREQWGKEYFTEPGELEDIQEDENLKSKVAFVDSTIKIVEKDEIIALEEISRKGHVISSKVEHQKEESTIESQDHDDLSSDASQAPSFKSETADCKEYSAESFRKGKTFKKDKEVYEVDFIKEIKVSTSPVKSTFSRTGSQDSHSELELAPDLPHDEKTDSPKKEILTPSPVKFGQQQVRAQIWEVSVEKPDSLEKFTKKGVAKSKIWSDNASSSKSSETVVETKDYLSKDTKVDLSPGGLEVSEELSTPSKDVMLKSGESIDTESMMRSLESHEAEVLQKSIDSNMSGETLHQSEISTEADSAFLTGTDNRKDRLVKEKSMEDICSSGYDTDFSSAEFHGTKLESERIDLNTFLTGSKPLADLSVLEKTIDEVKQSIEAAQEEILSEKSDGSSKYKQSPSEFQFKMLVSPDRPDVITEEPSHNEEQNKENNKISDSQISDTSTKTSSYGEITLSDEDKKTQVSLKETSPNPADFGDSSVKSDSGPHSILETEGDILLSDPDGSSKGSPEVKLRVQKHLKNRLGITDRRSASEVEGWSASSGSNYESLEHSESRPLSSDVDVMITAQSATEFQTALTSQDFSSNSMRTSKDYYTAGSSLASRDSMKSLDSDASSHVTSIDISDASETLVPSANELKEELLETSTYVEQFLHETDKKTMQKSTDSMEEEAIELDVDVTETNGTVSKMKRSHEMRFPPKDMIPENFTLDQVKAKNNCEKDFKTEELSQILDIHISSSASSDLKQEKETEMFECKKNESYNDQAIPFLVPKKVTSEQVLTNVDDEIIPIGSLEYESLVKHGSGDSKSSNQFIVKSSSTEVGQASLKEETLVKMIEVKEKCEKKMIKEISTVPFPVTKISSHREFSDIESEIIPSEDILKSQSVASVSKPQVEVFSGLDSNQSSTASLLTQEKCEKKVIKEISTVPFPVTKISSHREFSDIESEIIPSEDILKSQSVASVSKPQVEVFSGLDSNQRSTASLLTQEKCEKKVIKEISTVPFPVTKISSQREFSDIESEIIPAEDILKSQSDTSVSKPKLDEFSGLDSNQSSTASLLTQENCEKKMIKEISTVPFPVTKISSHREFSDIESEIIPSEDILKSQSDTSISKTKVEKFSGLDSNQSSTASLRTQENQSALHTPFSGLSQSSLSTDNGREYVIDDMYDISETPELKSDLLTDVSSRSECATIEEKTLQHEQERESPTSEEFEVVDKPDEIDDFVVIEEVAKEAHEADPEGKSVMITTQKLVKRHDTEVEELLYKTSKKQESASSASESLSDEELLAYELEQKKLQAQELAEIEAGKRWVQMQFEGDPRYDYERVPLEDIKEEEMTDFDASRIGSLSSQKESVGSCGSFRNSYGSLSESEMASRIRFRVKGDSDEISISSLQEFENLEKALMEQYQQNSSSSQDSLNGSLPRRYILSKSQGDDISISSLKEFEGLESACLEALKTEILAKQKEALLNADPKDVSGFFLEKEKRSYGSSTENSPPQKGGSPSQKDGSPSQKGGSPLQKSSSLSQKSTGSPSQKLLSESANIRKIIDQQMLIEQKLLNESVVTPKVITVKKFDDRGAYFVPEPDRDDTETKEITEICVKTSSFVCSVTSKDGSAESLPGDCEEMMKILNEREKSIQVKHDIDSSNSMQTEGTTINMNKSFKESTKGDPKAMEILRTKATDFESTSFTSEMSSSIASQQSDLDSMSTVVEKSINKIAKSDKSEEFDFERGDSQTRELSPLSGKDLVHGFGSGSGKQFTDPASGSWSCQDEDLSSSGSFSRGARENLMLGSTDSLEATSSNATRATYNYEVDTPMTGSLNSGAFPSPGSNTMVSSLDTLDPVTAVHMDSLEPTSTELDGQEPDSDIGNRTPRAKERTVMFDSTDTLSAVSGDSSVKEATVETPAMTFYIGDTPIPRGISPSSGEARDQEGLDQPVKSGSCPASLPPTTSQTSPPIPAQRRSLTMLAKSPPSSMEGSPKK